MSQKLSIRQNQQIFSSPLKFSHTLFNAWVGRAEDQLQMAVIVSKKKYPKAVTRNRVKRRLANLSRQLLSPTLPFSVIFNPKFSADHPSPQIKSALQQFENWLKSKRYVG